LNKKKPGNEADLSPHHYRALLLSQQEPGVLKVTGTAIQILKSRHKWADCQAFVKEASVTNL